MTETETYPILRFFAFEHLPEKLQAVSRPFGEAARKLAAMTVDELREEQRLLSHSQAAALLTGLQAAVDASLPANDEATWAVVKISTARDHIRDGCLDDGCHVAAVRPALRSLLEAKDCAVRATL